LSTPSYDFIVVGAGLFGSCFARIAADQGKRVLVIERRDHIGGNCYTEQKHGIHIHRYGPHIFHTSNEAVWRFVNRFASFNSFVNSPLAYSQGQLFSLPFNMLTFYQMWGLRWPHEVEAKLAEQRLHLDREPKNLEEQALALVGHDIYERLIKGYTQKQWQQDPRDLPAQIIRRLPLRLTYNNNYFNDKYQGVPAGGYTSMFERLLAGIEVRTGIDFHASRSFWEEQTTSIVYTGKIDELFAYEDGELDYRTLDFEDQWLDTDNYQGNAVINYCDVDVPYTRSIEHRHFDPPIQSQGMTVITHEIPAVWHRSKTPYYPINNSRNSKIYAAYSGKASALKSYILGGRLAEYCYYDMHAVIGSALVKAQQLGMEVDE
jgi:UDP-galactopyranose mutase